MNIFLASSSMSRPEFSLSTNRCSAISNVLRSMQRQVTRVAFPFCTHEVATGAFQEASKWTSKLWNAPRNGTKIRHITKALRKLISATLIPGLIHSLLIRSSISAAQV